jgi:putative ABC transport system permease protein
MNLLLTFRVALDALARHKLRASLTMLGMIIGVAAVILLVSLSQSAALVNQELFQEQMGSHMLIVRSGAPAAGGVRKGTGVTLRVSDAEAMENECPAVVAASPMYCENARLVAGNQNWQPQLVLGVSASYPLVRNQSVERGNFFTASDVRSATKVCVLGATVVDHLFPTRDCVGQHVRISNVPFEIIGVFRPKGRNMDGGDQDNLAVIPSTTLEKRLHGSAFPNSVPRIFVSARSAERMPEAQGQITALLRQRHRTRSDDADDFSIYDTTQMVESLRKTDLTMTLLLGSVAGVSLVVGGVGIMTIMLVSVTERTREIGIRLAAGARPRDVLWQFLVEAVTHSLLGGAIGTIAGVAAVVGIAEVKNVFFPYTRWPLVISLEAVVVSTLFAFSVGVFFGYYPARKASQLDPIESLRYE